MHLRISQTAIDRRLLMGPIHRTDMSFQLEGQDISTVPDISACHTHGILIIVGATRETTISIFYFWVYVCLYTSTRLLKYKRLKIYATSYSDQRPWHGQITILWAFLVFASNMILNWGYGTYLQIIRSKPYVYI